MPVRSKSISLLLMLMLMLLPALAHARSEYPDTVGARVRYDVTIDMSRAYISGILIMVRTDRDNIDASLVNEFGISLMDFSYDERRDKVKLHSVLRKIDKWYIRRVLRSDLRQVMRVMRQGGNEYYDRKHKIKYTFALIDETER